MHSLTRWSATLLCYCCVFAGIESPLLAQSGTRPVVSARDRITHPIDDSLTVRRPGNRHPLARPSFEIGAAPAEERMERMLLVLEPDPQQQAALEELLQNQYDPESPQFRQWLTPDEFGRRFGVSDRDLEQVSRWLESHGFTVDEVTAGRRSIVFSGAVAQVESAFHTQIRHYRVNGVLHRANATDLEIPRALAGVVHGVATLHDFGRAPMHVAQPVGAAAPEYTNGSSHYLAPADFATIYDVAPLYGSGIDGTGQTIAIVGRTNINVSDVTLFRSKMGLPVNNPIVVLNGPNPGILNTNELMEALLDTEWSGAVAKKASVKLVVSASTYSTDGVDLSAQYIVNNNLASALSVSFGSCEANMGTAENRFYNNLWQQAAAQGITAFISSGDSGAAGCDGSGATAAAHGLGVNGLCSSPYSVCVGGTQFAEGASPSTYWSSTTNSSNYSSALSYIPETSWNESGAVSGGSQLWATGGGASILYAKPTWQIGQGVPADGKRDVPDVSLSAAGHDAYLVTMNGNLYGVGGTSASSPAFAGLMALVNQSTNSRQGNANPLFYGFATRQTAGGARVFHDITTGSNSVPGATGFNAGAGYDLATGLGSVDAFVMVNNWSAAPPPANFQVAAAPAALTLASGAVGKVQVTVTLSNGFSGTMALSASSLPAGLTAGFAPASFAAPGSGTSTLTLTAGTNLAPGTYPIQITGTANTTSRSATVTVTVPAPPSLAVSLTAPSASVIQGVGVGVGVVVTGASGFNAAVTLSVQGMPAGVTAQLIPASIAAPGSGTSTLWLNVAANAPPATKTLTVTASGGGLTKQAAFQLTVTPPPFTLGLSTGSITLKAGTNTTFNATVTIASGVTSAISLSAVSVPSGVTASFTPASVSGAGARASSVKLTAASNAVPGKYTFGVMASGPGYSSTYLLVLNVTR